MQRWVVSATGRSFSGPASRTGTDGVSARSGSRIGIEMRIEDRKNMSTEDPYASVNQLADWNFALELWSVGRLLSALRILRKSHGGLILR